MTPNRFLQRLAKLLADQPGCPFAQLRVDGEWREMTRAGLAGRMGAHAAAWLGAGVRQGDVVFIILRHGIDPMPAFLAAMWIGAVPSFLPHPNPRQDPVLYRRTHVEVLRRTGAKALMTEPELMDGFRELMTQQGASVILAPPSPGDAAPLPPLVERAEDAAALLQHSSGTTGLKKGVTLTYRAITDQLDAYAPQLGLDAHSRIVTWLPLYHDMGLVACFLLPALLGVPIVSMDPFEWVARPQLLLEAIAAHRGTHAWLPNFAFAHLVRSVPAAPLYDLSSVVMLIGCSEANRPEVFDRFLSRFVGWGLQPTALQTCYAMAETVFAISQSARESRPRRLGVRIEGTRVLPGDQIMLSNGPPLPGVVVSVLHDGTMSREEGIVGELCVASPFNFNGYFGTHSGTGPHEIHRTGDIGFLDGGEIFVLGRTDDRISVYGRAIHAHDIEAAVCTVPGIHPGRCVALGVDSARTGSQEIIVVAEARDRSPALAAAVNRIMVKQFGLAAAAVELVPPGWLCKTTSGKVSRADNLAKYRDTFGTRPECAP